MEATLLIILGAAIGLLSNIGVERWKAERRRTVVLLALEEELRAVAFNPPARSFGGFTSQTFDALFSDIAALLPPETARRIIRYHLRMKHLAGRRAPHPDGIEHVRQVENLRDELLKDIKRQQPKKLVAAAEELEG